jgi:hypothetical protein
LKLVFREYQSAIQQTLQAHLGLDALRIVHISSGEAHHCLQSDAAHPYSIQIRFFSSGAAAATSERELAQELEAVLFPAGPPFILVKAAAVASCAPLDEQEQDDVSAEGVGAEGDDMEEPRPEEVESMLTLTFRNYTEGSYTPLGLKLVLEEHQSVIQQTLQAHFGFDAFRIVSISSAVAHRRLQSDIPSPLSMQIRFFAIGAAAVRSDRETARVLNAAWSNAGAPIVVETVAVEWGAPQSFKTIERPHNDTDNSFLPIIGGLVAAVLSGSGMMFLGVWACKKCAQRKDDQKPDETQTKGVPADEESVVYDAKKAEDLEGGSESTQSPTDGASDDTSSSGGLDGTSHPVVSKESSTTSPDWHDEKTIGV